MKIKLTTIIAAAMGLASCQSYREQTQEMRLELYQNRPEAALKIVDSSAIAKSSSDKVLYLMERGNILYLQDKYKDAAQVWDEALRLIDALYTVSVSKQASSYLVNETVTDYEGEAHEKVLLPVFSALAYLAAGEPNSAIVEARRTAKILENITASSEGKNLYKRDAFAHYLAGVIFEIKREWDNAIIEYKRAFEAVQENHGWAADVQIEAYALALSRVAIARGRRDITDKIGRELPNFKYTPDSSLSEKAEVVVIYEAGKTPTKKAEDTFVGMGAKVVRISYPVFVDEYYASRSAAVYVNGILAARTFVAQDIGAMARQALADKKPKYIAKMIARNAAKFVLAHEAERRLGPLAGLAVSVAGAGIEVADTRSWSTLPDLMTVARVAVPVGQKVAVRVVPDYGTPRDFQVENLSPGQIKLVRLRTYE